MMFLRRAARLTAILVLALHSFADAQSSSSVVTSVKTAIGKLTYLRVPDGNANLHFDRTGMLLGKPDPCAWTVCSPLMPTDVRIEGNALIISGNRAVAIYDRDSSSLVPLRMSQKFSVSMDLLAAADSGTATSVLTTVFDTSDMSSKLRDYWQPNSSLSKDQPASDCVVGSLNNRAVYKAACEGIHVPRALHTPDPAYSEIARKNKISAGGIFDVVVNEEGLPEIIAISKKAGAGLDINAIEAVSQWRFAPAIRYQETVPCLLQIEVTFKLY
jgi:hypothetical protein